MRFPTKCIVFLACWATVLATPAKIDDADFGGDSSVRDPKLLFSFITIAPENCTAASATTRMGVCYSAADCTTLAGVADGTCARGLGVCCLITRTCGSTSSFRETTFINPANPTAQPAALSGCQLRITPASNNICQLRLDYEDFLIAQPDINGVCTTDFLQVTGGSSNIPRICGLNTGQHMYVDVSPQFGSALLNIDTSQAGARWRIKVTQIDCNSADRAPAGCLQYFTTTTGMISSFNFDPTDTNSPATRQLANQMYGVCIKSQPGYCSISYTQTPGTTFSMSSDPNALPPGAGLPLVGDDPSASQGCPLDYIIIPGGVITDVSQITPGVTSADRYCGLSFPGATSTVQPFNLFVVTNGAELDLVGGNTDSSNKGFRLNYRMLAC